MKIIFSFYNLKLSTLFYYILYAVFFIGILDSIAGQDDNAISRKEILSARLDSLELEKQMRKRKGDPLGDLEDECRRVHDSIAALRVAIVGTDESIPRREKAAGKGSFIVSFLRSFFKPTHIFDWIIIVVGFIALLSGVVLIIGLIHSIIKRTRRKSQSSLYPPQKKIHTEKLPKSLHEMPLSEPNRTTDKSDKDIDTLRRRMHKDIENIQRFNTADSPFSPQDDVHESLTDQEKKDTVRENIIRAAKEGLDVQEISRKYHISADQVSLILRIADKGDSESS